MPARLVALDGTADIPIVGPLTVVGRHRDCDARLDSSRVSRRHCCLAPAGDAVLVRDLGSTNGVKLNGRRVDEGLLRPGDVLSIAHLQFRLDLPMPGGAAIPAGEAAGPDPRPAAPARGTLPGPDVLEGGPTDGKDPSIGLTRGH
jgi:hypothetical protein